MNEQSTSLNKYISETGICSRREADKMIEAGRVLLNREVAVKGNRVFKGDEVLLDGSPIINKVKHIYLALNKPAGITSTTDLKDKSNIIDFINHEQRIFPIGRLDKASTGLILLTNNGDIVNKILRQENNHEKEYIVTVNKPITEKFIHQMSKGVPILGQMTKKCRVVKKGEYKFSIILTQGLNRQIRRMCEYLDYRVRTLKRLRIMHINLGDLKVGTWRELTKDEHDKLFSLIS